MRNGSSGIAEMGRRAINVILRPFGVRLDLYEMKNGQLLPVGDKHGDRLPQSSPSKATPGGKGMGNRM